MPAMTAAAGLTLEELSGILVANDVQVTVVPSVRDITLGGAIATASNVRFFFSVSSGYIYANHDQSSIVILFDRSIE